MAAQVWTPEMDDKLRAMRLMGWSSSQIGTVMGKSRNAVIGRACRLHLAVPKPVITQELEARLKARRERRNKWRSERDRERRQERKPVWPPRPLKVYVVPELPTEAPVSLNLPLQAWTPFSCRWIEGDDGLACGHIGYPWCPFHMRSGHQQRSAKREYAEAAE